MAPLRVERAPGGSRLGVTRAQRPTALCLPPLLLLLLLLLGAVSASPESLNQSLPESQNQSHPTEDSLVSKGECLSLWESDLEGRINPTREESFHKTT